MVKHAPKPGSASVSTDFIVGALHTDQYVVAAAGPVLQHQPIADQAVVCTARADEDLVASMLIVGKGSWGIAEKRSHPLLPYFVQGEAAFRAKLFLFFQLSYVKMRSDRVFDQ
jgi:hypothetical protein